MAAIVYQSASTSGPIPRAALLRRIERVRGTQSKMPDSIPLNLTLSCCRSVPSSEPFPPLSQEIVVFERTPVEGVRLLSDMYNVDSRGRMSWTLEITLGVSARERGGTTRKTVTAWQK